MIKLKLVDNWHRLWKSYSILAHLVNLLIALSFVGLGALPAISDYIPPHYLFCAVGVLSVLGIVGRILKQGIEDV
jgi:uncharacterized membrane protein